MKAISGGPGRTPKPGRDLRMATGPDHVPVAIARCPTARVVASYLGEVEPGFRRVVRSGYCASTFERQGPCDLRHDWAIDRLREGDHQSSRYAGVRSGLRLVSSPNGWAWIQRPHSQPSAPDESRRMPTAIRLGRARRQHQDPTRADQAAALLQRSGNQNRAFLAEPTHCCSPSTKRKQTSLPSLIR